MEVEIRNEGGKLVRTITLEDPRPEFCRLFNLLHVGLVATPASDEPSPVLAGDFLGDLYPSG